MSNVRWRVILALSIILVPVLILLSGCTTEGIERAKKAADTAAKVFIADTCAISLGAYFRLPNPNHKTGAELICDPNANAPITLEGMRRLMEAR